ncbi:MAG: hypothetical protein IPN76_14065 [Saprospiraceae bacterium]|nr:hypothetical protein [Saprospiraceae bacterium]
MEAERGGKRYLLAEYDPATMKLRHTLLFSSEFFGTVAAGGRQIRKDAAGTIWVATYANMIRLFPNQLFIPESAPGMVKQAGGIAQAGDGNLWVASNGNGMVGFDGVSLAEQPKGLSKTATFVTSGYADKSGNVYFSSSVPYQGILKFDGKNHWENLVGNKNVLGYYITNDKKGQLLWGTMNNGLWILPKGKLGKDTSDWLKINKAKGLELDNVLTALEDRYGRYWMGRLSQGIAMFDPKQNKVVNWLRTQDPKHFGCMSMAEDARGNLWFGTDKGLCFFENRPGIAPDFDLNAAMQLVGLDFTGQLPVASCILYDANTLIFGNEAGFYLLDLAAFYESPSGVLVRSFNEMNGYQAGAVGQNSFFIDRDSCLWMTANGGVARFDPGALPPDLAMPQVLLDSLVADGRVFRDFSKPIKLAGERFIQIYFHSPPNPLLNDNIRFEYRLSGDSTWISVPPSDESITVSLDDLTGT